MMKRTMSLLLALSICLCMVFVPAQAADMKYDAADTAQRVEALQALGVLDYDVTEEMYTQPVSRAELYGAGMGLLGDLTDPLQYQEYTFGDIAALPEANKIQFACEMGTLDASWKFDPNADGRVGEFVKLVVSVLGYREIAEEKGNGETGFMSTANRINLLTGVSVSKDDTLVWEDVISMLYNALDIELMHLVGYENNDVKFLDITGVTALNFYFDIYSVRGVVNANEYTGLIGHNDAGEDRVKVGDDIIKVGTSNAGDLLGYDIEGYAKEEHGVYTMIYASPSNQNREWYIPADNLMPGDIAWSAYSIVYEDVNGKSKRLTLPADVSVIYNGIQLFDFTADDLAVTLGSLTAVDNNNDGTPEVVLVDEYVNYIVDSVNTEDQIITSKNMPKLSLEDTEDWYLESVNGDAYPLAELSEYTILSISASKNLELIRGVVVKEKVSGQVTGIKTVDGKQVLNFDMTTVTVSAAWDSTEYDDKPEIALSKRYVVYLDKNGEAAAFVEKSSGLMYAFAYQVAVDGTFARNVTFKLFTETGTWEELAVASKVSVNSAEQITAFEFANQIENRTATALVDANGKLIQQLVKVMVNDDNQISRIYTAQASSDDGEALLKGPEISGKYKTTAATIADFKYALSGTKIFILPLSGTTYLEDYFEVTSSSFMQNDKSYSFAESYDLSDTNTPAVMVYKNPISSADYWQSYAIYVRNVMEVYENGETYIALDCINKGIEVLYRATEDELLDGVKQGDVLVAHLNSNKVIDCAPVKIYEKNNFTQGENTLSISSDNQQKVYSGYVSAKDSQNILIDDGTAGGRVLPKSSAKYVVYYDEDASDSSEMLRIGNISEASKGARIIMYVRSGMLYDVIVFE